MFESSVLRGRVLYTLISFYNFSLIHVLITKVRARNFKCVWFIS